MLKEKTISALIATAFFAVFQPLGMAHMGTWERICFTGAIFTIALLSCLACECITRYVLRLPHPASAPELVKRDPGYMVKRGVAFQSLNVVVLTVLVSLLFERFGSNGHVNDSLSIENILRIFVLVIGCSFFIGLYWRNIYMRRHYAKELEEAQMLNGMLMERARQKKITPNGEETEGKPAKQEEPVTIEGSTKERLTILLTDFLFAESEGNYVSIHHIEGGSEKQTLLRSSIKHLVCTLCIDANIIQCHRAYVVNLEHVTNVEGRSSGIGLKIRHSETIVPVAKAYVAEVKERIENPCQPSHP